jgi:branched-chain amino acid transport system substrate-binding protein
MFATTIKIGFLTPYSSIYPGLAPSIINGFYCSMPEQYQNMFTFYPEFVNQGGPKAVKEGVMKLLQFHNVDIVSGLASYRTVPDIIQLIESRKKFAFFFDMGEYVPYTQHISNYFFFNSFQMWQSEYALGYWAHKEFGDQGAIIMPHYDSGYHLHCSFRQGTVMAGSQAIDYHILPFREGKSQISDDLEHFFEIFRKNPPAYIHAIFCGSEAVEFLTAFSQSGLAGNIPLIVSAHMGAEEMLAQTGNISLKMYSASMWDYNSLDEENIKFKQLYRNRTGFRADIFSLLGYEMGKLFYNQIPELMKKDWEAVSQNIKRERIKTPRGERSFFLDSNYATPIINIEKIELDNGKMRKLSINQGTSLKYNHDIFMEIHNECISGWQNPYLCI